MLRPGDASSACLLLGFTRCRRQSQILNINQVLTGDAEANEKMAPEASDSEETKASDSDSEEAKAA